MWTVSAVAMTLIPMSVITRLHIVCSHQFKLLDLSQGHLMAYSSPRLFSSSRSGNILYHYLVSVFWEGPAAVHPMS